MKCSNYSLLAIALMSALILANASCSSEKKSETSSSTGTGTSTIVVTPGEAGGMMQDTFSATATVSAIDASSRKITLTDADGTKSSFTAPPEVRNFDQLKVGDKVTATFTERLVVFVRSDGADPSVTHAAALSAAPKGAKPGAMVAESYEIVASVKAINTATRTASLQFSDGQTRTVSVRPDVDLSKYKVGDSVVIRVTEALSVLVKAP